MLNCDTHIHRNVTLKIAQQVTTQTTVKTHQSYQHITTAPLCCVRQYGNKLPLILLNVIFRQINFNNASQNKMCVCVCV